MSQDLRNQVVAKIKECLEIAEKHYGRKFKMPTISWQLSGGTAGRAWHSRWHIDMHPGYLEKHPTETINNTGPHELAHLICGTIYPETTKRDLSFNYSGGFSRGKRSPHGEEWRSVMRVLGIPEHEITRCHDMGRVTPRRQKAGSETVRCNLCSKEYSLGRARAERLRESPRSVWCRCSKRSQLLFVSAIEDDGDDHDFEDAPTTPVAPMSDFLADLTAAINGAKLPELKKEVQQFHATQAADKHPSKIDKCWDLYKRNPAASRSMMISTFVSVAGCTPAGAGTYYATCKKRYEAGVM